MSNYTLTPEEFSSLSVLARKGAASEEERRGVDSFIRAIEIRNGVQRDSWLIRWQDASAPRPAGEFPGDWPPTQEYLMERIDRRITSVDIQRYVDSRASNPILILVTRDPGGVVGWTKLADAFPT